LNGRKVELRSKTPAGVVQETYGLLIAHYLIRTMMAQAAVTVPIDPRQLSFTDTLCILRIRLPQAPPSTQRAALAVWLDHLLLEIARQQLRPRRDRICPRAVKAGHTPFPIKKRS